ncbi:MAG: NUDIX hydrolase, partial [Phenylobacterium sp.]
MSPHASADEMREWIAGHLDPLDGEPASTVASDFDLGPNAFPNEPVSLKPAAVLVGLIERPYGYSVLLTRRADTLRSHTGQIALPGGRCDPGETSPVTALREAHEEVGLAPDYVTLAGLSSPYRTGT